MLNVKGKQVKIFKPNRDCKELINTLTIIEPTIKSVEDMSKLSKYQQLKD